MPVIVNGHTDGEWKISPDWVTGGVVMTLVRRGQRHTATFAAEEMPLAEQVLAEVPETGSTDLTAAFVAAIGRDPFEPRPVERGWFAYAIGLWGGSSAALGNHAGWGWLRLCGAAVALVSAVCLARYVWRRLRR